MKKLLIFSVLLVFFISCNDDDGDNDNENVSVDTNDYFPATENALWNYNYDIESQGQESSGQTSVSMNGTTTIDGISYQILDNTSYLIGGMPQILFKKDANNEITIRPLLAMEGEVIDLGELPLIRNNVMEGLLVAEQMSIITGDPIQIPTNAYNITGTVTPNTTITVKNYHVSKPDQLSVNNQSFSNINHHELIYEIKVVLLIEANMETAGISIPIYNEHELISTQEFGDLELWLAKDIGIIQTEYDYSFEDVDINTTLSATGISVDLLDLAPDLTEFYNTIDVEGEAEIIDYSL